MSAPPVAAKIVVPGGGACGVAIAADHLEAALHAARADVARARTMVAKTRAAYLATVSGSVARAAREAYEAALEEESAAAARLVRARAQMHVSGCFVSRPEFYH